MNRTILRLGAAIATTVALAVGAGVTARANTPTPQPIVGAATVTGNPADLAFDMRGFLTLHDDGFYTGRCAGTGGYSDIRGGTNVTVWNADGKIVGAGYLDPGAVAQGDCMFSWSVDNVPAGQGPYQYEISHRGRLTLTEQQARNSPLAELGTR